ncbi:C-type lectin domain family 10 member A-like [Rana temporaria]|uniref:C-type lectin domain family 10 member A-like n=1 Tax=Rana temporaria TaxID=8407 RepID=UPI001AADC508|nr:C-type lectin domain family 10 member A-like [Rana temporaria]
MVINSLEEMNFLSNISQSQSLWIGLSVDKGIWTWVDGTSYERSPKFWREGQPFSWDYYGFDQDSSEHFFELFQHHIEERCVFLEDGEGWSSSSCSDSYQYVCEKKTL